MHGVKAKTQYPARPDGWTLSDWPPDLAFELVKAGLLRGKSIGFIPLKMRPPTAEEIGKNSDDATVRYIIENWLLAEYACCYSPMHAKRGCRDGIEIGAGGVGGIVGFAEDAERGIHVAGGGGIGGETDAVALPPDAQCFWRRRKVRAWRRARGRIE